MNLITCRGWDINNMLPVSHWLSFFSLQVSCVWPGFRPAIPNIFPQIRDRDIPDGCYLEPWVPPVLSGSAGWPFPPDICLRPTSHAEARRGMDEAAATLRLHLHPRRRSQLRRVHLYGQYHVGRQWNNWGSHHVNTVCQKVLSQLTISWFHIQRLCNPSLYKYLWL